MTPFPTSRHSIFDVLLLLLFLIVTPRLPAQTTANGQSSELITTPEGDKLLRWYGHTGRTYFVQISSNNNPLAKWFWAPMIEAGSNENISHEVDGSTSKVFFRLKYTDQPVPPGKTLDTADFDQDGLSNLTEIDPPPSLFANNATDPLNEDTDDDGLTDGYERTHNLDPNDDGTTDPNNGPTGDPDNDGVSNIQEYQSGTNSGNGGDFPPHMITAERWEYGKGLIAPAAGSWAFFNLYSWTANSVTQSNEDHFSLNLMVGKLASLLYPQLPGAAEDGFFRNFTMNTGFISGSHTTSDGSISQATIRQQGVWLKAPPMPMLREYKFLKVTEKKNLTATPPPAPTVTVEPVTIQIEPNQTYSAHYELATLPDLVVGSEMSAYCVLLPVDVVPDYNRDGMINDEDRGKVTEEKPFVFWTNDDDDANAEPHVGDIPGTQVDGADMLVNDARDLVDFFPMQLRIKEILAVLPADKYTYKISHPTGAFHFIEMPDVHPDSSPLAQGAGAYLRNPTMADDAMSRPMLDTAGQGAELTAEYLNAAKDGMGVLLFEAKSATNQSFELIISKKDGGGEVGRITRAMPVEIVDVEKMFWRANIRPAAYGQTPGAIQEPTNAKFKASRKERWCVFCHGYNVSEEAAKGWNAEMFKRLHQMGSDSKFLGVTWEGNQGQINPAIPFAGGATPDYWQNVYNAFQSSASLSTLVNGLSGGAKVIAGHSLGNMLVSSAICDKNLNAEKYFMLNAAVPREAYSTSHVADRLLVRNPSWSQHDGDTRLWASDYWNLFPNNDGRHKLTWNGRFSTLGANAAVHNYYSSGEEVLKKGNGSKPNLFLDVTIKSQFAWVKQEMSKGELTKKLVTGTHSSNGGWAYNSAWNGNPPADSTLLKATPYFKPFTDFYDANGQNPQSIHDTNGSNLAAQYPLRGFLLGHDIPAISNPAGSDFVDGYSGSNMNTQLRSGNWGDWKHSDIKNQDLGHVWKVYSDMVSRGSLNKDLTPPPTN